MLFPTATFAVFFLIALPLSWALMPRQPVWRVFTVTASYVFYGWWDWRYVFLLAGSTLVNQILAIAVHRTESRGRRKALLWAAVVANLGTLAYLKYAGFFLSSAQNVLSTLGLEGAFPIVATALPVGVSFYTFMALSYVIDVHRGTLAPTSLAKFAVFLSFYPHLVAGPIVRGSELIPQLDSPRDPRRVEGTRAFFLIASGIFMKVVVANSLATDIVDPVFASPGQYAALDVLAGIVGYSAQIFADFLGYTNIAIGIALLLGFRFPTNFDAPYTALSVRDFWRRWHMTLSRWLRDYLYIPLGGNHGSGAETYRNLMLVMLIGGLWHGASWTFVVWGGMHGVALVAEHWRADRRRARGLPEPMDTPRRRALLRVGTFAFVTFAWIFFRADSFSAAGDVIERLFTGWGAPVEALSLTVAAAIAVAIGGQYVPRAVWDGIMSWYAKRSIVVQAVALGAALLVINALGPEGVAPFIYFQF